MKTWLDGNGVAGLLDEAFGADVTAWRRLCDSCGETHPIAAHRAYRGAGWVLRCPGCEDVAVLVVDGTDRFVVRVLGALEVARG